MPITDACLAKCSILKLAVVSICPGGDVSGCTDAHYQRLRREMPDKLMPTGRFANSLSDHMNSKEITIRDLSNLVNITYEHARRLVKGGALPSLRLLKDICSSLRVDQRAWEKLVVADQMEQKFGGIPAALAGKNPDAVPFERVISQLTEEQRQTFLVQMRAVASKNKRR
jgi:hypothetical protein